MESHDNLKVTGNEKPIFSQSVNKGRFWTDREGELGNKIIHVTFWLQAFPCWELNNCVTFLSSRELPISLIMMTWIFILWRNSEKFPKPRCDSEITKAFLQMPSLEKLLRSWNEGFLIFLKISEPLKLPRDSWDGWNADKPLGWVSFANFAAQLRMNFCAPRENTTQGKE